MMKSKSESAVTPKKEGSLSPKMGRRQSVMLPSMLSKSTKKKTHKKIEDPETEELM